MRVGDVVRSSLELGDPNSGFSLAPNAYELNSFSEAVINETFLKYLRRFNGSKDYCSLLKFLIEGRRTEAGVTVLLRCLTLIFKALRVSNLLEYIA